MAPRAWWLGATLLAALGAIPPALPMDPGSAPAQMCFASAGVAGCSGGLLGRGRCLTRASSGGGGGASRVGAQHARRVHRGGGGHEVQKIRIMEEVVRLAADPSLEYRGKVATVRKLVEKLQEMRAATAAQKAPRRARGSSEAGLASARETLSRLEEARVVAVLRGGHPERMLARGMELALMDGCSAIEVALDSPGALDVLRELALTVPPSVTIGAATVMSAKQARAAVRCGARFVTSPINPAGLTAAAHAEGALALPGGMTPSEIGAILSEGALAVKLFPAGAYTPSTLSQVLAVGPFRNAKVMVSGGLGPSQLGEWVRAGASIVTMGGALVGKDVGIESPPGMERHAAEDDWELRGRQEAIDFFTSLL